MYVFNSAITFLLFRAQSRIIHDLLKVISFEEY